MQNRQSGGESAQSTLRLLRYCFTLTPLVAIAVGTVIGDIGVGLEDQLPIYPFVALAALTVLLSFKLPVFILSRRLQGDHLSLSEQQIAQIFILTRIIGFALRELPTVIGLLLTLLTGDSGWVIGLGLVSLLIMSRPSPSVAQLNAYLPAEQRWH